MIEDVASSQRSERAAPARGPGRGRATGRHNPKRSAGSPSAAVPSAASVQRLPMGTGAGPGFQARVFGLTCMSLGAHMLVFGVLGFMPSPAQVFAHQDIQIEVIEPAKLPDPIREAPPPPKAQEPEVTHPKPAPRLAAPKPSAAPEPPKSAAPQPSAEAPVDFTGVTLTAADGVGRWSTVVGNGEAIKGPAPRIAKVTGRDQAGSSADVAGPPLVDEASLARKPIPPGGMNDLLEQNFPPRARAQGVSGSALLRVRIGADGRVGDMKIMRETGDYGFGEACMKTLRTRRWQPPLDRHGNPVTTDIRYSCEFEVGY